MNLDREEVEQSIGGTKQLKSRLKRVSERALS